MNAKESQEAVMDFLRGEFRHERESDFAVLRCIPSASPRKFLDYFFALKVADQDALSEAFVQRALLLFFPSAPHPYRSGNSAYKRYVDALPLMWNLKYEGVRMLRLQLAAYKQSPEYWHAHGMTVEDVQMIEAIKPVKSTEIRRVVKLALSQLFTSLAITNRGGGVWRHEGIFQGKQISMDIDYGGMNDQLRYEIAVHDNKRGIKLERLSYEQVIGFPTANWNCLEQSNLDQSIALLKDFIVYCAEIPNRLPVEYKPDEKI